MLWGWLDGCIVCAKPDGENADFWDMLLFVLFRETLLTMDQFLRSSRLAT
jgi:hypothetical protein